MSKTRHIVTWMLPAGFAFMLSACSPTQQAAVQKAAATPEGALFCAFALSSGGQMVVNVASTAAVAAVAGAAPAAAPAAGMVLALAKDATQAEVNQACAKAAATVPGATGGAPVAPPVNATNVPVVAIPLPAGMQTITVSAS